MGQGSKAQLCSRGRPTLVARETQSWKCRAWTHALEDSGRAPGEDWVRSMERPTAAAGRWATSTSTSAGQGSLPSGCPAVSPDVAAQTLREGGPGWTGGMGWVVFLCWVLGQK